MSLETIDQQLCKEDFPGLTKEQIAEMLYRVDHTPVQEVMVSDFYEEDKEEVENNEMLELLHFMQENGVPLKNEQVKAMFLMQEMGVGDIAKFMVEMKPKVTPFQRFFELINKITLADRIKGNAKLSGLVKAQVASANGVMPEMQKHMREQQRIQREVNR
ncbi:hypothetical protein EEL55_029855 [Bacillus thuringiensis]|uniref:Uncharacterized protein n=2 Tax=Bacillus thuringiensis TaxID=1428 RepID=Q2HYG9_BACTT|nr:MULTISPECIES: hypothetical protein [Bacillus]ABC95174.1 hypothetical protein [Bacillus thuringiensis serovar tenebrionis]MED3102300.1 hypothetical protein [Bacillus thuringiensis]WMR09790.1 hypothetical protein RCI28_29025 [Bacillus thuringiensis serovar tenebrionis]WMR16348.1 hypothetical protein RCI27_31925 [Bacillus thuringiensis serovar tenebrionis]WMR22364.1 hypothetical protein RCI26_31960 [Bacillus thuringiensis serovar tenebrionis]